jgi:hypothetical protein
MPLVANGNLSKARLAKNDEFYTQYADIETEMNAYLEFDADVFRDKTVLLPCDDPEWSNFTKYFAQNFETLGLMKLISTSYAPDSKPPELNQQPTLFEFTSPIFDNVKTRANGKIFVLERDVTGDGRVNVNDLEWNYLAGDGDFRSDEVKRLRDEADIIITNPPFSLFREFLAWITESGKRFVMIGNKNAITYREVFPLIKENKMWLGSTPMSIDLMFGVPESVAAELVKTKREGSAWRRVEGVVLGRASSVWFSNLDHGRRHQPLPLMTEADNIKFSKHKEVKGVGYSRYDNYDAIEIPFTDAIPSDYKGVMGVPISFLSKHSPEQFEIVGNGQTMADEIGIRPVGQEFVDDYYAQGNKGSINYRIGPKVVVPYQRILIRHRQPSK